MSARPVGRARRLEPWQVWLIGLPVVVGLTLRLALAPRADYFGQFLVGFGAGLLAVVAASRWKPGRPWWLAGGVVACIGLGGIAEATVFRLAGFDGIDFWTLSLGAVLAGLALAHVGTEPGGEEAAHPAQHVPFIAIVALVLGAYYAFT